MHRIAQFASSSTPSFVNIAFAGAALVCVLMARPGLASEDVGASAAPRQVHADLQATTPLPPLARVDFDGFPHHAASVGAPAQAGRPDHEGVAEAAKPASSIGTMVEPATIAVLGFTAAALIALRRRKNADA